MNNLKTQFEKYVNRVDKEEDDEEITLKNIMKDIGKFLVAMLVGIVIEFIFFKLTQLSTNLNKSVSTSIIGGLQLVINIIIITLLKKFRVNGSLTIMGLFLPQTLIIQSLHRPSKILD